MGSYNNLDFVPTTARKEHQCSQCGKFIQPGVIYFKYLPTPHHPTYSSDCKDAKISEKRPWRKTGTSKTSHLRSSPFWDVDDEFPFLLVFGISGILTAIVLFFVTFVYSQSPLFPTAAFSTIGEVILYLSFLGFLELRLESPTNLPKLTNKGRFSCKYHASHFNTGWCVKCGAPLCDHCMTYFTTIFNSKLPICPSCRHHKKQLFLGINLLLFIPLLITGIACLIIDTFYPLWYTYLFFGYLFLFYSLFTILLFSIVYLSGRKNHKRWQDGISELRIIKALSDHEILPCTHDLNPAVTRCERCGDSICHQCLHINVRRSLKDWSLQGKEHLCVECYWTEKKLSTINILLLTCLFFVPILVILPIYPFILTFGSISVPLLGFYSYKIIKYQWLYSKLKTGQRIPVPIQDLLLNGRFYVSLGFGLFLAALFIFLNSILTYSALIFLIVGFALWNYERYIHLKRNTTLPKRVKDREIITKICIHLFLAGSWLGITALYIIPLHIPGDFTFILGMVGLFLLLTAFLLLLFINIIERWSDTAKSILKATPP